MDDLEQDLADRITAAIAQTLRRELAEQSAEDRVLEARLSAMSTAELLAFLHAEAGAAPGVAERFRCENAYVEITDPPKRRASHG